MTLAVLGQIAKGTRTQADDLMVAILRSNEKRLIEVVEQGLASRGHAAFVKRLEAKRRKARRRRHKPRKLAGDKGYSCQRLRDWLAGQDIEAVIPHKDNERARHDPEHGHCGADDAGRHRKHRRGEYHHQVERAAHRREQHAER